MTTLNRMRPDLLLLLSLLLMILLHPILDRSTLRRLLVEVLIFLPVVLATIRLAEIKHQEQVDLIREVFYYRNEMGVSGGVFCCDGSRTLPVSSSGA